MLHMILDNRDYKAAWVLVAMDVGGHFERVGLSHVQHHWCYHDGDGLDVVNGRALHEFFENISLSSALMRTVRLG